MDSPQQPGGQTQPKTSLRDRILTSIVKRRGELVLGAAGVTAVIVLAEQGVIRRFGTQAHLLFGVALIATVPLAVWGALQLLSDAAGAREEAVQAGEVNAALSRQLGEAETWDELISCIVRYPHQIAPHTKVTLYVHRPDATRLAPEAQCARDGTVALRPVLPLNPDSLPVGSLPQLLLQQANSGADLRGLPPHRYDLPIMRSDHTIAVLKLEYPPDRSPAAAEIRALQTAAPLIGLALEARLLQDMAAKQAADSAEERQRIAQNLHDTLAQNVGYLRLKLDQLTGENAIHEIGMVLQELERMRAAADEAYGQVRQTLDQLSPLPAGDLAGLLAPQAQAICQRAGMKLVIHQNGTPFPLPANTRQQILYITREALHNVEKHAGAAQVTMTYLWQPTELILKISDDGNGFNPRAVAGEQTGHYGLWIMQRRATEIGGMLQVQADHGSGSEVTLWLPRAAGLPPQPEALEG